MRQARPNPGRGGGRERIPPRLVVPRELTVGHRGRWFRRGEGRATELHGREALPALLALLTEYRGIAPGAPLSYDFVFMTLWPGALPSSAEVARRVRGAVCTLEALGLTQVIVLQDGAVYLDPEVNVVLEPEPAEVAV